MAVLSVRWSRRSARQPICDPCRVAFRPGGVGRVRRRREGADRATDRRWCRRGRCRRIAIAVAQPADGASPPRLDARGRDETGPAAAEADPTLPIFARTPVARQEGTFGDETSPRYSRPRRLNTGAVPGGRCRRVPGAVQPFSERNPRIMAVRASSWSMNRSVPCLDPERITTAEGTAAAASIVAASDG